MAQPAYDIQTEQMQSQGLRVFQGAMFADDEAEHCRVLHHRFGITPGSLIVDMGCGIAEVCVQFLAIDPSLKCVAVTNEPVQHTQIPEPIHAVLSDFAHTPFSDGFADAVMFNESFGYGDVRLLLAESRRLLKVGGRLCIKDFSFDHYSPTIVETEQAWGYKVHAVDALAAYAEEHGFKVVTIQPKIKCCLARWVDACDNSPAFDRHRHLSDEGNLFAAIYVFEKTVPQRLQYEEVLSHAMKGNVDAINLINDWHAVLHVWDDLIDGDKPITAAQVNNAFTLALTTIPANKFFQQNTERLLPLLSSGITSWHIANVMENNGCRELLAQAHMHRVQIGSVFIACAEIIGGRDWAVETGPAMWRLIQDDRLSQYIKEIELINQDYVKDSI